MIDLKKINKIANIVFSDEELEFSDLLYQKVKQLNLDDNSLIASYFLNIDLKVNSNRKLIKDNFGELIIPKIELIKRLDRISLPESKKEIATLRKLFIELVDDLSIIFIKLSERLLKLELAEKYDKLDIEKHAKECLYLYSPIAHRLGIRVIYMAMDDIAFKYLFPEEYRKLYVAIEKRREILERKLKEMSAKVKMLLEKNNINAKIKFRVKRLYSIFSKIKNKGVALNEIYDLMALRIITDKIESCYATLGVVHTNWLPIEGRFRDWVAFPKPNGYRSIQTTVLTRNGDKFEIQIRTKEMNHEAEYGSAAHWTYKEKTIDNDMWVSRLKEFLETDEYFDNPYELQELLKSELKRDFIYILTPKGDIKSLKKDATPIDFAYAIHTEVGAKVTGALVNGKLTKLKTPLKSGDVVEVITNKNAKPSRDWLNYVQTQKARSKILLWIKKNEKEQLINDGRRIWEKFKKSYKRKYPEINDEQSFKSNLVNIGFKSTDDFYSAISINSLKCSQTLLRKLYPDAFKKTKRKINQDSSVIAKKAPKIEVDGMKNIQTSIAKCCNPIKGEPIIAYITQKSEIKIHSKKCKYVLSGNFDSERFKPANWIETESMQIVKLKIYGYNYESMLDFVTEEASVEKLELKNLDRKNAGKNIICIVIELEINDIVQLRKFTSKLELSRNINSVVIA